MTTTHTAVATARVPTASASRYLQQLCKHWAHKLDVAFDPEHGTIRFPNGAKTTLDAEAEALAVRIGAPNAQTLAQMQHVVAEHLDRFAYREAPLAFAWVEQD